MTVACRKAQVGRGTFYDWKPRFTQKGYAGLETYEKAGVSPGTGRIAEEIEAKVLEMHGAHAEWGKRRMGDEMAKANNGVPLISPNSIRRILLEAGMWKPEENRVKKVRLHR